MSRYVLELSREGGEPREVRVGRPVLIGRSEECDLVVRGDGVDDRHLRLEPSADGLRVIDQGSTGGTRIDGRFVSVEVLHPGEELSFGVYRARLVGGAARDPRDEVPARAVPAPIEVAAPVAPPRNLRSGVTRRKERSKLANVAVVGGVLLAIVLIVVLVIGTFGGGDDDAATKALDEAYAMQSEGRTLQAIAAFERVQAEWPGTDAAARAESAIRLIRHDERRETEAARRLEETWAKRTEVGPARLRDEFRAIARDIEATRAATEFGDVDERITGYYEPLAEQAFAEAEKEAVARMTRRQFADALLVWRAYLRDDPRIPRRAEAARQAMDGVRDAATRFFQERTAEIDDLVANGLFDRAREEMLDAADRLAGTPWSARALERARAIGRGDAAAVVDPDAGSDTTAPTPERTVPSAVREQLEEVALLLRERRYADGLSICRALSGRVDDDDLKRDVDARIAELTQLADLKALVSKQVREMPARFRDLPVAGRQGGSLVEADGERLTFTISGGKTVRLWSRIDSARLFSIFERLQLDAAGKAAFGRFCFVEGFEKEGHERLCEADDAGAGSATIDAILSRARAIPVPEGGFVRHAGRWWTPEEKVVAERRDLIASLAKAAASSDVKKREAALTQLRALGPDAVAALRTALENRRTALAASLASPAIRGGGVVAALVKELEAARKHALSLIYDTKAYPYDRSQPNPYGPDGPKVQKEVDDRVAAVAKIWYTPLEFLAERREELRGLLDELRALDEEIVALGGTAEYDDLVKAANERFGIAEAAGGSHRENSLAFMAANAADSKEIINDEERACVREVNRYRMMMGLHAVRIVPELVQACRSHSAEMARLGYFDHMSPTPENRTPNMRAKNAGYSGGVSENIAQGSTTGYDVHRQWCHSSGHHRNILAPGHRKIGVGQAETRWWTELFSR